MNRKQKWMLIIAFILGAVMATIGSDPTDFLFLQRAGEANIPPSESVGYWFLLSPGFYLGLLAVAYVAMKTRTVSPRSFMYFLIGLTVIGGGLSLMYVDGSRLASAIVLGTVLISVWVLWRVKRQVE